jgi:hypothetical protein
VTEKELVQRDETETPYCSVEVGFDAKGGLRVKSVKLRFDAESDIPRLRNQAMNAVQAAIAAASTGEENHGQ